MLFDKFYRNLLSGQNDQFPMPEKLKSTKQAKFPEKNTIFDWICTKQGSETWIPWTHALNNINSTITQVKNFKMYYSALVNLKMKRA